jgi:tetratricopeptide (TPR) repeat protein
MVKRYLLPLFASLSFTAPIASHAQLDQTYGNQQRQEQRAASRLEAHKKECVRIARAAEYEHTASNLAVENGKVFIAYDNNVWQYCGYLGDLGKEVMLTAWGIPNKCIPGTYQYQSCQATPNNVRFLFKIENNNLVAYHQHATARGASVEKIVYTKIVSFNNKQRSKEASKYFDSGTAKHKSGDFKGAIADWSKVISLSPSANAYYNRGLGKRNLGNHKGAVTDISKAIDMNSSDFKYYYYRALSRTKLKNHQGAIDDLSKAIALKPMASSYNGRAWNKYLLGDYQSALIDVNKSLSMKADDKHALDTRGRVLHALGQSKSGCDDLKRASSLGGKDTSEYLQSEEGAWCKNN